MHAIQRGWCPKEPCHDPNLDDLRDGADHLVVGLGVVHTHIGVVHELEFALGPFHLDGVGARVSRNLDVAGDGDWFGSNDSSWVPRRSDYWTMATSSRRLSAHGRFGQTAHHDWWRR